MLDLLKKSEVKINLTEKSRASQKSLYSILNNLITGIAGMISQIALLSMRIYLLGYKIDEVIGNEKINQIIFVHESVFVSEMTRSQSQQLDNNSMEGIEYENEKKPIA